VHPYGCHPALTEYLRVSILELFFDNVKRSALIVSDIVGMPASLLVQTGILWRPSSAGSRCAAPGGTPPCFLAAFPGLTPRATRSMPPSGLAVWLTPVWPTPPGSRLPGVERPPGSSLRRVPPAGLSAAVLP